MIVFLSVSYKVHVCSSIEEFRRPGNDSACLVTDTNIHTYIHTYMHTYTDFPEEMTEI